MTTEMIALISGFVGALIGGASSVLVILIQEHHQGKRERARLAAELGIKDYDNMLEITKQQQGPARILPLASSVLFHERVIRQLETGRFSPEDYKRIMAEQHEITEVIAQVSDERRKDRAEQSA